MIFKPFAIISFLLGAAVAAPVAGSSGTLPVPSGSFSGAPPAFSELPSGSLSFLAPSGLPTQLTGHPSGGPPAPTGYFPIPSGSFSLPPPFSGTPPSPSGSFSGPHPSWTAVPPN